MMNIFATYDCPVQSALALDDKRVIKMVLETAQLLSSALWRYGVTDDRLYKPTHVNHPCADWAKKTRENFNWLVDHGLALGEVYSHAYGRVHKSVETILRAESYGYKIPEGGRTDFANCTTMKSFLDTRPVTERYQEYLRLKWSQENPTWRGRSTPDFLKSLK